MSSAQRSHPSALLRRHVRRGSMLVYSLFLMVVMLSVLSLAVDYGRVQVIKTQLQRDADATARGALQMYANDGAAVATSVAPAMASNTYNPVDGNSGVQPTVVITWGYWNTSTKTFTAGSGSPLAVQVNVSRTKANGNSVPLTFPLMNGLTALITSCDVQASATAYMTSSTSTSSTVPGTSDIWLSGMPAGSTASDVDTTTNAAPTLAMSVTPGTILTFRSTGGTGYNQNSGTVSADGFTGYNIWHQEYSTTGNYNGLQNGIQTFTGPASALIGVFLTSAQPSTQTPPSTALDYSTSASQNQSSYTSLQVQQPFFIGNGQNTSGTTQSFVVPPGATRLYLGSFDQDNNADNPGSLTVTTTQQAQVYLVK